MSEFDAPKGWREQKTSRIAKPIGLMVLAILSYASGEIKSRTPEIIAEQLSRPSAHEDYEGGPEAGSASCISLAINTVSTNPYKVRVSAFTEVTGDAALKSVLYSFETDQPSELDQVMVNAVDKNQTITSAEYTFPEGTSLSKKSITAIPEYEVNKGIFGSPKYCESDFSGQPVFKPLG